MFKKTLNKVRENKKGFTLAELLIVVAIIAVLVAISIPIFNSQLEKSRDAVTASNLRAAYAQASAEVLTESNTTQGNLTSTQEVTVKGTQANGAFGTDSAFDLPFDVSPIATQMDKATGNGKVNVTFTWTETNGVLATQPTVAIAAAGQ